MALNVIFYHGDPVDQRPVHGVDDVEGANEIPVADDIPVNRFLFFPGMDQVRVNEKLEFIICEVGPVYSGKKIKVGLWFVREKVFL